jgi:para-nitrobenzyl esterase
MVRGTDTLPRDPAAAIRDGDFARVPVLIGGTRDEGRAFTIGYVGWSRQDYESWLTDTLGGVADKVEAQYPWPSETSAFTPAYLAAEVMTDGGTIGSTSPHIEQGIGGCATLALVRAIARHTKTFAYEWAPQTGPGIATLRGYSDAAGHGSELAYLWPNFEQNGVRIASLFGPGQRRLSEQTVRYWGAFVKTGSPGDAGGPSWPPYTTASPAVLSLRTNADTTLTSDATIADEHRCAFWSTLEGG